MSCETMWDKVLELARQAPRPAPGQDVFLFGGGLCGSLTIPLLRNELNLTAVCDNDKGKQGTQIQGLPCVSPQALDKYENSFVLVSSCEHYWSIHKELKERNILHSNLDAYVIRKNLEIFQEMYRSLDEESQRVYAGILYCRFLGDPSKIAEYCCDNQYFALPQFRYGNKNGVCVDCGAFTGDIVQKVIDNSMGLLCRIYAFEPNPKAYAALKKRTKFLKDIWALDEGQIVCEQKGVGAKSSYASLRTNVANLANVSVSVTDDNRGGVEIVTLDDYLAQQDIEKITFLKSDIEGFEWDMLHGAARTIQRDKPNMAISIYHSIFDYFRIFKYLKELVPEYTFAVRHHWNNFDETVLYCYVK